MRRRANRILDKHGWWYPVLVTLTTISLVRGCSVLNLATESIGATSAMVKWETDCHNVNSFKLYASQVSWKACDKVINSSTPQHFELGQTKERYYQFHRLLPYSVYNIDVLPLEESEENSHSVVRVETHQAEPSMAPKKSKDPKAFKQAIWISWEPSNDCQLQNGIPGGHHVVVKGTDPWTLDQPDSQREFDLNEGINLAYIDKLMPFSHYEVNVYVRNTNGLWNQDRPLRFELQTQPDAPHPPTDIKLVPSEESVSVQWLPPYPPTGEVTGYKVRIGVEGDWKSEQTVPATQRKCKGTDNICLEVNNLSPDTEYEFAIQTVQKGFEEPSPTSVVTKARTLMLPKVSNATVVTPTTVEAETETSSREPRAHEDDSDGSDQSLVIILCVLAAVVVICLACVFLLYKFNVRKIKMQYEHQSSSNSVISNGFPAHSFNDFSPGSHRMSMNSTYMSGMSTFTDTTLMSRGSRPSISKPSRKSSNIDEIQSRRLPEPPPVDTSTVSRRSSHPLDSPIPPIIYNDDHKSEISLEYLDSMDQLDIAGYLKPTFLSGSSRRILDQSQVSNQDIPIESYESPRDLVIPATSTATNQDYVSKVSPNQQHPLLTSTSSVQV